jgi:hypothetical protein
MCYYLTNRCRNCHAQLSSHPINCGNGLAILGLSGMTIECAHESAEIIEESKICCECVENGSTDDTESGLEKWFAWRRK